MLRRVKLNMAMQFDVCGICKPRTQACNCELCKKHNLPFNYNCPKFQTKA
jgi:hypothetical protein